eukprot:jgi/Bigna1/131112/aug1.13_g5820
MLGLVQAAQVGVEDFLIKQAFKKRKGLTAVPIGEKNFLSNPEQSKVFHNLFDDMGIGEPTETRHLRVQWPESTGLKWKHEQKRFTVSHKYQQTSHEKLIHIFDSYKFQILVADLDANPKFDLVNEFNPSLEAKDVKQRIGFNLEDFTQVNDLELHAVNFFTSVYESPEKEKARLEKLKLEAELGVDNDENGRRAIGVNKRSAATVTVASLEATLRSD